MVTNKSMQANHTIENELLRLLETVYDPEIPVLSVIDLGIVRAVKLSSQKNGKKDSIEIIITPTYSGCPAMHTIEWDIKTKLLENGFMDVIVSTILHPAWTTEWMSEAGKQKLKAFGIAPPNAIASVCNIDAFAAEEAVACPHCNSYHTKLISQFGSTACKALYKCEDCLEPFDYFKCH
jgi:ring-1,2-phenylacetyl-CoA epoxidase subunit PaaD